MAGPGCRPDEYVEVSARLINTLYAFAHSAASHPSRETRFLDLADPDELLLLSHSLGGSVAFSVLTGRLLTPCTGMLCLHGMHLNRDIIPFSGSLWGYCKA